MLKKILTTLVVLVLVGVAAVAAVINTRDGQNFILKTMAERGTRGAGGATLADAPGLTVAICGSGSPLPDLGRAQACTAVFAAGKMWLVDTGGGSARTAGVMRLPTAKLAGILITHFHSDHIADMAEFKLQSWVQGRKGALNVWGGPGIERVVGGFGEAYAIDDGYRTAHHGADLLAPADGQLAAKPILKADGTPLGPNESVVIHDEDGLKITAFTVEHPPITPAYGYRFDYKGRAVVISGDTHKTDMITNAAKGADVLIHEAMAMDLVEMLQGITAANGAPRPSKIFHDIRDYHASPRDAAETAKAAGVPYLLLTHLVPALPQVLAERVFTRDLGGITGVTAKVAFDGMLIRLPEGSKAVEFGRAN